MLSFYWLISKRCRDPFSGSIMYDRAEAVLYKKYGENEFTETFIEHLDKIEDFEMAWKERKKN